MKKLVLLIPCMFLLVFTNFSESKNNFTSLSQKTAEIKRKLDFIESKYISVLSYQERRQAIKTMDDVVLLVSAIESDGHGPQQPSPMPDYKFHRLIQRLRKIGQSWEQKYELFKRSVDAYYSVEQLVQILQVFKFDDDKLEVVVTLYPKLVGIQRLDKVLDSLTFQKSKKDLGDLLKKYEKQGYMEPE
jgi:hypothetical protein